MTKMTEKEVIIEEEEHHSDVIKWISAGFGIGLLVGGIVGLLLAPKAGKESRAQLKEFTGDLSEKTQKLAKDLGDKVVTTAKDLGDKVVTTKEAITESYKAGKAKYEQTKTGTSDSD